MATDRLAKKSCQKMACWLRTPTDSNAAARTGRSVAIYASFICLAGVLGLIGEYIMARSFMGGSWAAFTWQMPLYLASVLLCLFVRYRVLVQEWSEEGYLVHAVMIQTLVVLFSSNIQTSDVTVLADGPSYGLLWLCILMVAFPLVVPAPTKVHAWIAGVSAVTPFVWWTSREVLGLPNVDATRIAGITLDTAVCAAIGVFAASGQNRLSRDLAKARADMKELGSYELVRLLGRGGMGEVWLAKHRMLARPAAIKLVSAEKLGAGSEADHLLERFEREARVTAQLKSPHTVEVYDFGRTEDGSFYYVMELLDGIDLEQLVEEHGPQPAERVVHILRQMCCSLAEAHAKELIHRDIKPANVFLSRQGLQVDVVKVLDFGLVKPRQIDQDSTPMLGDPIRLTAPNSIPGTPAYIAPEVALGEDDIDQRSDLYAVGCVAYWLLTGKMVFNRGTPMKTMMAHVREEPDSPSVHNPEIPGLLEAVVMRLLAKSPDERYGSAIDVAMTLEALPLDRPWNNQRMQAWWHGKPSSAEIEAVSVA